MYLGYIKYLVNYKEDFDRPDVIVVINAPSLEQADLKLTKHVADLNKENHEFNRNSEARFVGKVTDTAKLKSI